MKDIADGNMVTLQVFREGQSPEDSAAIAKFPLTVKGGSVSAKWLYRADQSVMPPEQNPKFIFTAHCAWCNFEKSSNTLEVELIRPEITKAEWRDKDGNPTSKGLVDEPIKLFAETKDMDGGVTFRVYDESKREVFSKGADIADGKAEAEWTYHWNGEKLDHKPKFTFEVTGQRCKMVESGEVEIGQVFEINIEDKMLNKFDNEKFKLINVTSGEEIEANFDPEKKLIKNEDLVPGEYKVEIDNSDDIDLTYGQDNLIG